MCNHCCSPLSSNGKCTAIIQVSLQSIRAVLDVLSPSWSYCLGGTRCPQTDTLDAAPDRHLELPQCWNWGWVRYTACCSDSKDSLSTSAKAPYAMELDCPVTQTKQNKTSSGFKIYDAKLNSSAEDRASLVTMKHPFSKIFQRIVA